MSDRLLALAYAAVEGRDYPAARRHIEAALAAGDRRPLELLAVVHYLQSDFAGALARFEEARREGASTADGLGRLIRIHLLAGDPHAGWQMLRDCCTHNLFGPPLYSVPRWAGEPLAGRRIAVWGAGYGDDILAARFVPQLADAGAIVYVNCRPALIPLLKTLRGVQDVLPLDVEAPGVELHANFAELGYYFGAADGRVWPQNGPYLHADPITLPAGGTRVGLVWAADSRHLEADDRTAALADMMPLAQVPGVQLFSLQVGRFAAQMSPAPAGMTIHDLSPGFPDFAEQASQILGLDLVITVDTAVANLAGALGARVWVAVPFIPDWRWGLTGDRTPWYPIARVYRQPSRGDWRSVFRAMARDLATLAG
ncbi:MAG: tetratricopeptide repeat protein [Vicinamibacterales bacterium]